MAVRSQWYWEGNKLMFTLLPIKTGTFLSDQYGDVIQDDHDGNHVDFNQDDTYDSDPYVSQDDPDGNDNDVSWDGPDDNDVDCTVARAKKIVHRKLISSLSPAKIAFFSNGAHLSHLSKSIKRTKTMKSLRQIMHFYRISQAGHQLQEVNHYIWLGLKST